MPNNWLDDAFWLKMAYHGWRVPLPINSNWWILMADDTNVPEPIRTLKELPPRGSSSSPDEDTRAETLSTGEYTDWQIKRAAKLTHRMMEFKRKMDRCACDPSEVLKQPLTRSLAAKNLCQILQEPDLSACINTLGTLHSNCLQANRADHSGSACSA